MSERAKGREREKGREGERNLELEYYGGKQGHSALGNAEEG